MKRNVTLVFRGLLATLSFLVGPLRAQLPVTAFSELEAGHLPTDLGSISAAAAGDVDGDFDLDLLVVENDAVHGTIHGPHVRFYRNDGDAIFEHVLGGVPTGYVTHQIALVDLDGDLDLDLVLGNDGFRGILWRNDGLGNFTDVTTAWGLGYGADVEAMAVGDVDGDSDLDLVLGGTSDGGTGQQTRLFLNDGSGRMTDRTAWMPADQYIRTRGMALGDLDGDGDLDLVLGNQPSFFGSGWRNRIYANDGTGRFSDVTIGTLPFDEDSTEDVALGDLDGDGDLDLVTANVEPLRAGRLENQLYLNDGTGTFQEATTGRLSTLPLETNRVRLVDLDGDGDLDVVFANRRPAGDAADRRGRNEVHWNDGTGRFLPGSLPWNTDTTGAIACFDADSDGDLDLYFGNQAERDSLFLNLGGQRFVDVGGDRLPRDRVYMHLSVLSDVDGDGDLDLAFFGGGEPVLGYPGSAQRLYANDGQGTFRPRAGFPATLIDVTAAIAEDVDGDLDPDFVITTDRLVHFFRNDGTGTFEDLTTTHFPPDEARRTSVVAGDLDGDSDLDLVLGREFEGDEIWINDGTGRFQDETAARLATDDDQEGVHVLFDADSDGDLDLFVGVTRSTVWPPRNRLYLNDGMGVFTEVGATNLPSRPYEDTRAAVAIDFDSDLDLDLVFLDGGLPSVVRLLRNDGNGSFVDVTAGNVGFAPFANSNFVAFDADENGTQDLFLAQDPPTALVGDGASKFVWNDDVFPARPIDGWFDGYVVAGDLDRDGDIDLIAGDRVLFNLRRQVHAPRALQIGRPFRLRHWDSPLYTNPFSTVLPFASPRALVPALQLIPFGLVLLDPFALVALPPVAIDPPTGQALVTIHVPNDLALVFESLHVQDLVLHEPSPLKWRLSNASVRVVWP